MCIINEEAIVSKTQLFVSPNIDKTRQITVYANNVSTESRNNMMILPVPYPNSVKFIDLSEYSSIFRDLERSFDDGVDDACLFGGGSSNSRSLNVVDVGSYKATLAKTHEELDLIDKDVFGIVADKIKNILYKYQGEKVPGPFGYIVCKLKTGSVNYHPFAYEHQMTNDKMLFVPTRHEHNDGPRMQMSGRYEKDPENMARWDHSIYSFNTDKSSGTNGGFGNISLRFKNIPFEFGPIYSFHKLIIEGLSKNGDVVFKQTDKTDSVIPIVDKSNEPEEFYDPFDNDDDGY